MSNKNVLLESYIQEIDNWLPYPKKKKSRLLENLRSEVIEAIQDTGNSDPVIAFGDPYQIAKGLSLSQDWGTKPAGWGIRTLAFMIDAILIANIRFAYHLTFHNAKLSFIMKFYRIKLGNASYSFTFYLK